MFYSKSFIVSDLTFRSLIHFEFILVSDVKECSNFILFLHVTEIMVKGVTGRLTVFED